MLHRSFKRFDPDKLRADLSEAPWSVMDTFDSADDKASFFNQLFLQILNEHSPIRRVRVKKNGSPWVNKDIRDQMDTRVKLLHRFRDTGALKIGNPTESSATRLQPCYMKQRANTSPAKLYNY